MAGRAGARLPENLPQLQGLIRRDPEGYRDEFLQQCRRFEALLAVFALQPGGDGRELAELGLFLGHVAHCYPRDMAGASVLRSV